MKRLIGILLFMVVVAVASIHFTATRITAQSSGSGTNPNQPLEAQYQRQLEDNEKDMKRANELMKAQEDRAKRSEALLDKQDEMIKRQEDALARYEKILDTWEKQQKQYQKYLDSLGK